MGILSLFKRDEKEKNVYQTLVIQQILKDIENLKKTNEEFKIIIDELQNKAKNTDLTPLENKIYMTYNKNYKKSSKEIAKILNIKVNSLNVYKSKIKAKGYTFNK